MSQCQLCEHISKGQHILHKGEKLVSMLADQPAITGHLITAPIDHAPIAEQISDDVLGDMFVQANKLSAELFEKLGAQGTTILLQNGLAAGQSINHTLVNIIPRAEGDGLNLEWQPKQITGEEMTAIENLLREEIIAINKEPSQKKEEKKEDKKEAKEEKKEISPEEDYMIRQLERIP